MQITCKSMSLSIWWDLAAADMHKGQCRVANLADEGKTVTATVTDRCEGCAMRDVDMTPTLFSQIADMGKGRLGINGTPPITWQWI